MKAALLIGNGLNRCYSNELPEISWSDLLTGIAQDNNVKFVSQNSFPLEFECLVNDICRTPVKTSDDTIASVKKAIADQVIGLQPVADSIHHRFMALPISEIMTTNYDYMLERAVAPNTIIRPGSAAPKHSLKRNSTIKGKRFHHIHGEAKTPGSICLGYDHYAGYLAYIRKYVKDSLDIKETLLKAPLSSDKSWIDLMFTHDVYIVGLTCDVCEIDLWWLLTYRAYLYNLDPAVRDNLKNEITLYDNVSMPPLTAEEMEAYTEKQKARKRLFERLRVNYVPVHIAENDYLSAYKTIANKIEKTVGERALV